MSLINVDVHLLQIKSIVDKDKQEFSS